MKKKRSEDLIWYPYYRFGSAKPINVSKGSKEFLFSEDGQKIIDGVSSWWTNIHGHSNPAIVKAVSKQIAELDHVIFSGFTHKPALDLAAMLIHILPGDPSKIFFSDNGSTAVEVALKMSLQYWTNKGKPRKKIIVFEGSYHGDTFGAMSVSERGSFTKPFSDLLFDPLVIPVPYDGEEERSLNALKKIISENPDDIAAFIYEPLVLGTAGMKMYSAEKMNELLKILKEKDVLLIADEVMTGFGRTGKLFASEYILTKPDIVCLSKGITGGVLPMGVTSATSQVYSVFADSDPSKTFYHGHSYTGNPVAIAAAVASTKLFLSSKKIFAELKRIASAHKRFASSISKAHRSKLNDVRQTGTILAIELNTGDSGYHFKGRDELYNYFLSKGVLLRPLGNVIYILPPYCISDASLKKIYKAIESYLCEYKAES
jgi:adenosylmethionine---8-amino-7-oxononanoate aminotransferase